MLLQSKLRVTISFKWETRSCTKQTKQIFEKIYDRITFLFVTFYTVILFLFLDLNIIIPVFWLHEIPMKIPIKFYSVLEQWITYLS